MVTYDKYIPDGILTQVLVILPAKSLLRFRCVSKTWRDIIDHPDFIAIHFNYIKNKINDEENYCYISLLEWEEHAGEELLFTLHRSDTLRTSCAAPQLMITNVEPYRPCASVDGMILLFLMAPPENVLLLWNPSIRTYVMLPPCPWAIDFTHLFAVGFCPSSNEYKVFVFDFYCIMNMNKYGPSFGVYGLYDGSWRRSTKGMDVMNWSNCAISYHCVSAKGAAHWLIRYEDEEFYSHVISFDFDAEEFSFLELPYNGHGVEMVSFLFLLGESVAVLGFSPISVCIWVMNIGGGREPWYKWYSGESSGKTYTLFFENYRSVKICFLEKSGVFLISLYEKLIWYDIRSQEIQHVEKSNSLCDIYKYVESLLLWKSRGAQTQTLT